MGLCEFEVEVAGGIFALKEVKLGSWDFEEKVVYVD